jgi:hypothetical protein
MEHAGMSEEKPKRRGGRPPIFDFRNKLSEIGFYVIIAEKDKERARNAISQFKIEYNKRHSGTLGFIPFNYKTETLPSGEIRITRIREGSAVIETNEDAYVNTTEISHKGQYQFISEDMPHGVWYCLTESGTVFDVLFNSLERPIFERLPESGLIKATNRDRFRYSVVKTGWFFDGPDLNKSIMRANWGLVKWLNAQVTDKDFKFIANSSVPQIKTDQPLAKPLTANPSSHLSIVSLGDPV